MRPSFERDGSGGVGYVAIKFSANNPAPWPAGMHIGLNDWEVRIGMYSTGEYWQSQP